MLWGGNRRMGFLLPNWYSAQLISKVFWPIKSFLINQTNCFKCLDKNSNIFLNLFSNLTMLRKSPWSRLKYEKVIGKGNGKKKTGSRWAVLGRIPWGLTFAEFRTENGSSSQVTPLQLDKIQVLSNPSKYHAMAPHTETSGCQMVCKLSTLPTVPPPFHLSGTSAECPADLNLSLPSPGPYSHSLLFPLHSTYQAAMQNILAKYVFFVMWLDPMTQI